jgi:predicted nucleic-acid-binding protein
LFVAKTVVAELEWVLRGYYELTPAQIHAVLTHLLGLRNVTIEQATAVETALRYYQQGIDFADALHLASSQHCSMLLTFDDRKFARRARRLTLKPPVTVPSSA